MWCAERGHERVGSLTSGRRKTPICAWRLWQASRRQPRKRFAPFGSGANKTTSSIAACHRNVKSLGAKVGATGRDLYGDFPDSLPFVPFHDCAPINLLASSCLGHGSRWRYRLEGFEAAFTNVLNHTNHAPPTTNINCPSTFGELTIECAADRGERGKHAEAEEHDIRGSGRRNVVRNRGNTRICLRTRSSSPKAAGQSCARRAPILKDRSRKAQRRWL